MSLGLLTRLRPIGAWRFGPSDGGRDRVEPMLHSDSLYSALTWSMAQLGWRSHWLAETAESPEPSVALTSLYPAFRDHLLVTPPRSAWPPPPSARLRWKGARFVPLAVVRSLLAGEPLDESRWYVEPESECLLPLEKNPSGGPFRIASRIGSTVDRVRLSSVERKTACLEFAREGALWCWAQFRDDAARDSWSRRLQSAFRLLADAGIGGERSSGWGHSLPPRFREGDSASLLLNDHGEGEPFWWLLSVFNPSKSDAVDWTRGSYSVGERSGRTAHSGLEKRRLRVVSEGGVLASSACPVGRAVDVAPDGAGHPVYANGAAVAIRIPAPAWTRSLLYSRLAALAQAPTPPPAEPEPRTLEPEPVFDTAASAVAAEETASPTVETPAGEDAQQPIEPSAAPVTDAEPAAETPTEDDSHESETSADEPATPDQDTDDEGRP